MQIKNKRRCILLWVLALGWGAVLFFFSGQTGPESGDLSRMLTEWLLRTFPFLPWSVGQLEPVLRKLAHFTIFAIEGGLLAGALRLTLRRFAPGAVFAAVSCGVLAGLNEYHQSFVDGRNASVMDALIDTAGAVTGILLVVLAIRLAHRIAHRRKNVIY